MVIDQVRSYFEEPSSFVGRERELDELCGLTASLRAVTLCGPGGIGKTRLAQRILAGEPLRFTRPQSAADVPAPSLFQGTAGVGLTLLRCAAPELPSVLAWG